MTPSERQLSRMESFSPGTRDSQPWGRKRIVVGYGSDKPDISQEEYEIRWKLAFGTKEEKIVAAKRLEEIENGKS